MQQGGSQYGVPRPEMTPFSPSVAGNRAHVLGIPGSEQLQQNPTPPPPPQQQQIAEAASPISSRPPAPPPRQSNFDELVTAGSGNFAEDDAAGEEAERGGVPGNRWPRPETLALLKIRSEMDAVFRDATLKGPLWEDVSRKLAELGYVRSAKKCKEKFENVHKYYKRTKEGRAGRQDGKSYRFFTQLEALHSGAGGAVNNTPTAAAAAAVTPISSAANTLASPTSTPPGLIGMASPSGRLQLPPLPSISPTANAPRLAPEPPGGGISLSSNTSSSSASESDGEDTAEEGLPMEGRKRKRSGSRGSGEGESTRKMMEFFEGLLKRVMERQEAMQQRFLETIEKREQDRMIREEAWKRQEMARLNREHEMMAHECAVAASRDAAIIAFLQKLTGQTIQLPSLPAVTIPAAVPPPPPQTQPQPQPQQPPPPPPPPPVPVPLPPPVITPPPPPVPMEVVMVQEPHDAAGGGGGSTDPASSRWPKPEVHALIKLRSGLESRYQEAGPKGPLWEEISAGMRRMGYNRSSKRCKEKWENINKYFKKVKESNKKRPEDAKTCPYFHQLDALYRRKIITGGGDGGKQEHELIDPTTPYPNILPLASAPPATQQPQMASERKHGGNSNNVVDKNSGLSEGNGGSNLQIQASNGESVAKKPEDIVRKQMDHHRQQRQLDYDKLEAETDSDNMDEDDDEDHEEDDAERKMDHKIHFQRQNVKGASNGGGGGGGGGNHSAVAAGSFLAMVQ